MLGLGACCVRYLLPRGGGGWGVTCCGRHFTANTSCLQQSLPTTTRGNGDSLSASAVTEQSSRPSSPLMCGRRVMAASSVASNRTRDGTGVILTKSTPFRSQYLFPSPPPPPPPSSLAFLITSPATIARCYHRHPVSCLQWWPLLLTTGRSDFTAVRTNAHSLVGVRSYTTVGGRGSGRGSRWSSANKSTVTYMVAIAMAVVGLSYAAVPLYRLFCQASGYGGTVLVAVAGEKVEKMEPVRERELTIQFNSDTSASMQWQFKPHQREIKLVPGETALAFYTARNPTDEAVIGIATYNVIPFDAGQYFNKIQCFCFEEQRLNPKEQVDMPVFFYIDPEINEDPAMAKVDTITLSYTFFQAKEGEVLNLPHPLHHSN